MKILALLFVFFTSFVFAADGRVSIVLSDVRLVDLVRVAYGEIVHQPYLIDHALADSRNLFSVDLRQVDRSVAMSAVRDLVQEAGFEVEQRGDVVWIGKVKSSEQQVIVYRPRFRSARYLADVVQGVTGARSFLSRSVQNPNSQVGQSAVGGSEQNSLKQPSPTSVEGQIDRSEVDQIAFNVELKDVAKINKLLADLDTPAGEVVLKAAVYEVGFDKSEGSALQLAVHLAGLSAAFSGNVLSGGASVKFSQSGIEAVLQALDSDTRFKSISRPQLRVNNGSQARFSVGQDVPVLGQVQTDKAGNPLQSIDYKQSGVILTATPEIRQDVIELALHQELSNFVVTKTGVNGSPTLIKRAVDTKLAMKPGEVVVLAGLQDEQADETQDRLPFVGWLLGRQRQERRSEVLIFLEVVRI